MKFNGPWPDLYFGSEKDAEQIEQIAGEIKASMLPDLSHVRWLLELSQAIRHRLQKARGE